MQVGSRAGWLWSLALLSACTIGCARAKTTSASAASSGGEAGTQAGGDARAGGAVRETVPGARREMTWDEYYFDVEQRARRKGGFVMWLNPPRPVHRTSGPQPGIMHRGAPLSSSVR
jgi:hypothetical protein